eukprot:GHVU01176715.1.p2 GENE.GHVU01176715.1~~GHVU01176715.1.p2  ORF type:complete len:122 (-),score=21.06 GHVU01176715.1:82-447(-)
MAAAAEARASPGRSTGGTRVAFQGEAGAYSHCAVEEVFKADSVDPVGCPAFEDVHRAVKDGSVDFAMVPIENSLGGRIHQNYDLLLKEGLHVIGEYHLRVSHCLIACPGVREEEIRVVLSQ